MQLGYYIVHRQLAVDGIVDTSHRRGDCGVEFENTVVTLQQRTHHILPAELRGVGQHRNLGIRAIAVAQGAGVGNDSLKFRVHGRFAVAAESDNINTFTIFTFTIYN